MHLEKKEGCHPQLLLLMEVCIQNIGVRETTAGITEKCWKINKAKKKKRRMTRPPQKY